MNAIKVEKLTKKFNGFIAVDKISFTVRNGELFGLLGPNGAGKTTTINMLATLLKPTSGHAEVAGHDILKDKNGVRKSIGIVFQEPALDNKLTGRENLEFHAMMYGINKENRRKRIKEVLELVELTEKADILVENYSGGMKRRLEIARGLMHMPKILFLDEPTLGLDAQTRRHIWDYIKKLNNKSKVTIILTTHYMEEADYLCNRVAIMDHGKFVALDSPNKLKDVIGGDVVSIEINGSINLLINKIKTLKWIKSIKQHNGILSMTMEKGERRIPELINLAQKIGITVNSVHLRKPSLEDVFLYFTGRTIREEETSRTERNREIIIRRMRRRR
ncbi:ATP-binding cassette domain-containing protein [Candidatus Aminicenantes bacterium AH-873-B07]|jgi:ABC-2 type transport system ATP-binding protein|nr:ATP-binding cassette domain-containing protein [Candidatus Aminicenantes bacterium AH-873-B07]